MSKLTFHLWFDTQAKAAAAFYEKTFPGTKITSSTSISGTPSGDVDMLTLTIYDQQFSFISAGPIFKINPSISFTIRCDSQDEAKELWAKLSPSGKVMMELQEYPFSPLYGWIEDEYGVSWQLSCPQPGQGDGVTQKLTPSMLFVGKDTGRAEEAITFYTSVFKDSKVGMISRYPKNPGPDKEGTINFAAFTLEGVDFIAMDSALDHKFFFNEGVSIMVSCKGQEELDYYWNKLSAVPEAEQCGWLKDTFGVSWQIVPEEMGEMLSKGDDAAKGRVTQAFLQMKKFDIAALKKAYEGK